MIIGDLKRLKILELIVKKPSIEIVDFETECIFSRILIRLPSFLGEFSIISNKENEDFARLLFVFNKITDSYLLIALEEKIALDKKNK